MHLSRLVLQCFHCWITQNKTRLNITPYFTNKHALLPWQVQILQMETHSCLINYKECTLLAPLQRSAEKYAVKKPQGMWTVCSSLSLRTSILIRFGFGAEVKLSALTCLSWRATQRGGRAILKGRGCVKMGCVCMEKTGLWVLGKRFWTLQLARVWHRLWERNLK